MASVREGIAQPDVPRASFRDPHGVLLSSEGRIFRIVNSGGMADLEAFLASSAGQKLANSGALVRTSRVDGRECEPLFQNPGIQELYAGIHGEAILEHERIPFPSFPYEWPAEMLHRAGMLTIDLALELLPESLGLKDATPYNILFRGTRPVFIDILSFERRDPGDPRWLPYAQFVRTFLLPLLAARDFGMPLDQLLLTHRDGVEPEEFYRWLGPAAKLRPPFLSLVSLPVWLASRSRQDNTAIYQKKVLSNPEKARFIVRSLLHGLKRKLARLAPQTGTISKWTGYLESNNYPADHFAAKERFVAACLADHRPTAVLDVGCNTGHYSSIAARTGARVVAIDYDPVVLGRVFREAESLNLDILPLAVNLTRPTPSVGWNNREWPSFLDRARGSFDAVLMLAVIHHMLVTERVPLNSIIDLAAELTTDLLVLEFVSPQDSMFQRLARGREELYQDLSPDLFESSCRRRFEISSKQHMEGSHRWLYSLRRKKD